MKKYLIVGNGESPHILKWTKELVKYFEVYIISSQDVMPEIKDIIPRERIFTFNLSISESGGNFQFFNMILPLTRIIKKVQPDFVNAHYVTSHGFVAAVSKKLSKHKFKFIISAWGTDILVTPGRNFIYKWITRFALKQANLATTDSDRVAEIIHELASVETMTFPFGIEKIPDATPDDKDPYLFFSNRTLNANSNIDLILHFFAKIHDQNKDAILVIANDGSAKESLIKLTNELGIENAVDFVGFISAEEQNEYYRKSQYYFSILSSDALSVSLLEAMAYGCIPLVSDLPDNRDWVKNNENGIIMTASARADILSEVEAKAETIFHNNREMIRQRAIFPKSIEAYYQKLLDI
jgi:glycosyltransferase involved in cell wall biosynthesis